MILDTRFSLLIVILIFISNLGLAQPVVHEISASKARAIRSDSCIIALQNSTLIVRLPSFRKKIEALETIEKKHKSKRQRKIAAKRKKKQILERNFIHQSIIEGMYKYYTFSNFRITSDAFWEDFLNGKRENIFFNSKAEIDPTIKFNGDAYMMMRYGKKDFRLMNDQDIGFIVADSDQIDLNKPFPYFFDVFHTGKLFLHMFFVPIKNVYNNLGLEIFIFNTKLENYGKDADLRIAKREYKRKQKLERKRMKAKR